MKLGRNFKKAIAIGILSAMVGVMALPVSAATINVTNSTDGKSYIAYKLFDATYSGTNNAAYTVDTSTPNGSAAYNALKEGDVFVFSKVVGSDTVYNVTLAENKTNQDAVAALKTAFGDSSATGLTATKTVTGNGGTVALADVDNGYYYVTTANGTVVSIDNANGTVNVVDKNKAPGWEKDPTGGEDDETGKTVKNAENKYVKSSTATIGDTASFKINAYAPSTAGGKNVTAYTFTDTLDSGFTIKDVNNDTKIDANDINVAVTTDGTTAATASTYEVTVTELNNVVTVVVTPKTGYPVDAHVEITYDALVNDNAVRDNENKVTFDYTVDNDSGKDVDPTNPTKPTEDKTDTYVYNFNLDKYAEGVEHLAGAKFKLYTAETGGEEITVKADGSNYRVTTGTGTEIVTNGSAVVNVFGLKDGTYWLEETEAPAGYNTLTARQKVTVSSTTQTVRIENKAGSLFPSTGGAGRIAVYAVGGVLVVGFGVTMVSRKRSKIAE